MDTVIIHPEPASELKNLAKELLALADKGSDVEYIMWPESGFRIPEELFAKFVAGRAKNHPVPEPTEPVVEATEPEEVTEPVKRKPGRPKKIQEGQQ